MKKTTSILTTSGGFTLIEAMAVVMVLALLVSFAIATFDSLVAKSKYARTKSEMTGIAYAGYMDYTNNLGVWDVTPNPWTPPTSMLTSRLLEKWPQPVCPGYYYSWDNGAIFGLDVVRVSLRRSSDDAALWSYCVNTYGGGNCQAADIFGGVAPVDISVSNVKHFYCNE